MDTTHTAPVLEVGAFAYYDTFAGLVPCKVRKIITTEHGYNVVFTITAARGAYKRGEHHVAHSRHVIPRKAVHMRSGQYRIWPYTVRAA